jgi:hypothetical protein
VKEQEWEVQRSKADVGVATEAHKRFANAVRAVRKILVRMRQIISDTLSWPWEARGRREKEEEEGEAWCPVHALDVSHDPHLHYERLVD